MDILNNKTISCFCNNKKIKFKNYNMPYYWEPPVQEPSVAIPWTYSELINNYDSLMSRAPEYIKKYRYENENGSPILTQNGNYELYSYIFEPKNYTKTIFIQAGIHGNEMDAKQQLLKIADILVNKTNTKEYAVFKPIRENVRLVLIPCVSPYGHDNNNMNIPYNDSQYGINLNRNLDFMQQKSIASVGVGGDHPFCMEETQHIRDVIMKIGPENIDYAMDWHDGGKVKQHFWINYAVDGKNRTIVNNLISHLIKKYNITNPVIDYCNDTTDTGITVMYFAKTLGLSASTVEWMGGYLGYDFGSEQMTRSLEIRGNMILLAYKNDVKEWTINEKEDDAYFHFEYPKAFMREGLRPDGAEEINKVTDNKIYSRWDELYNKYPDYITKSQTVGTNPYGQSIYTYTLGNGPKKVLYIGGVMRYGATHKIDEFAIYELAEYLCNNYIVDQSKFLQDLKNNYTIIILPCIDNVAANTATDRNSGLNNMALSYKKWKIVENKCQPTDYALSVHDVPIIKQIIDNNKDLKCIVSGGEILTGYGGNTNIYSTEFETQFVIPKNQYDTTILSQYSDYLKNNKNENVIIEHTDGLTFGDYAFDNYQIPTYYIQLNVSKRYTELSADHTLTVDHYLHSNYESGRRISNIVNAFLL